MFDRSARARAELPHQQRTLFQGADFDGLFSPGMAYGHHQYHAVAHEAFVVHILARYTTFHQSKLNMLLQQQFDDLIRVATSGSDANVRLLAEKTCDHVRE